jgi:hypothetical protein
MVSMVGWLCFVMIFEVVVVGGLVVGSWMVAFDGRKAFFPFPEEITSGHPGDSAG